MGSHTSERFGEDGLCQGMEVGTKSWLLETISRLSEPNRKASAISTVKREKAMTPIIDHFLSMHVDQSGQKRALIYMPRASS